MHRIITLVALLGIAGTAHAGGENLVLYDTQMRARPAQKAAAIDDLELGDPVKVVGRKGRWAKVRAHGKLGWIPRSTYDWVDDSEGSDDEGDSIQTAEIDEVKGERVTKRRTKAYARPTKKSRVAFEVRRGARLGILKIGMKWTEVRNERGRSGWVRSSALESDNIDLSGSTTAESDDHSSDDIGDDASVRQLARERLNPGGLETRARAALGLSSYNRAFSSDGQGPLGGYELSVGSMVAAIDARARYHKSAFSIGVAGRYTGSMAAPGIRYENTDQMSDPNSLVIHDLEGGIELGFGFDSTRINATFGGSMSYFVVGEIQDNPGLLARERLAGPTASAGIEAALSPAILLDVGVGVMIAGKLHQTANLEDGTSSSVWALGGTARATYVLDPVNSFNVGYQGRRTAYEFSGQSRRQFDVTSAERTDTTHTLTVGAARSF